MKATYDDVKRLLGDLDDHMIAEVEGMEPTIRELEEISAYLARETDVMGHLRRSLTGRARAVYELVRQQEFKWQEDH